MRTTAQLRRIWAPPCSAPTATREILPGIRITCDPRAVEAFQALGSVLQAHRYHVRAGETGAYNCRLITGGRAHSLHAYGIAVDVNWNSNPYRADNRLVTDMPPEMIEDVRRVLTLREKPVFRWGGDFVRIKDAMHFEIVATPTELSHGIDWGRIAQPPRDPERPSTWLVVHPGDRGPTVRELQARLGVAADGIYGPITLGTVELYQREHGLSVDGVVGLQTWTALLTDQPPVSPGAPGPVKGANRVAAGPPGPEGTAGFDAAVEMLDSLDLEPTVVSRTPTVQAIIRARGVTPAESAPGLEVAEVLLRRIKASGNDRIRPALDAIANWTSSRPVSFPGPRE